MHDAPFSFSHVSHVDVARLWSSLFSRSLSRATIGIVRTYKSQYRVSESRESKVFSLFVHQQKVFMSGQPEPLASSERNPRNEEEADEDPSSPPRPEPPAPAPPNNIGRNRQTPEEEALILPPLPNETWTHICSFLGVQDILRTETVSRTYQKAARRALKEKKKPNAGIFKTKKQLKVATDKLITCKYVKFDPKLAEEIATDYGWIMNLWDVSQIEDFSWLFANQRKFNEDISMWKVGSGRYFGAMFLNVEGFKGDLSRWNLESAENLDWMFQGASSFCSDLSKWNLASVESMYSIFDGALSFTSDLSKWDTGKVRNISHMFAGASSFQSDLSGWNTSNVLEARGMFRGASSFESDLSGWNTASIRDMSYMFCKATLFKADLSGWNVDRALQDPFSTHGMFLNCSIKPEDVQDWTGWDCTLANSFRGVFLVFYESPVMMETKASRLPYFSDDYTR